MNKFIMLPTTKLIMMNNNETKLPLAMNCMYK